MFSSILVPKKTCFWGRAVARILPLGKVDPILMIFWHLLTILWYFLYGKVASGKKVASPDVHGSEIRLLTGTTRVLYLVATKRVNNNGESVEQNWCHHRRTLRDKPHKWNLPKMNWYILTAMISASCLNHLERGFVLFHLDLQTMVQVFQNDISRQAQIQDPSLVHGKSYLLNWWNERYIRAFVR